MREKPLGGFTGAGAEEADAVEEVVEARRQRFQADGAGRIEEDEAVDRLALADELARDFVGDDAAGGPATEAVRAPGLATLDFGFVEG